MTFVHCPPVKLPDLRKITELTGVRHYIVDGGVRLPSITTVLGAAPNFSLEKWKKSVGPEESRKVSSIATNRGTGMHNMIEEYLNNGTPKPQARYHAWESFVAIKPLLNRINNIHFIEQALWSRALGVAGSVDTIAEFDGLLSVIDYKSSKRIKTLDMIEDYFIQTCAYSCMYKEMTGITVPQLVILMHVDGDRPLVFKQKAIDYVPQLLKAIKLYREINREKLESTHDKLQNLSA